MIGKPVGHGKGIVSLNFQGEGIELLYGRRRGAHEFGAY